MATGVRWFVFLALVLTGYFAISDGWLSFVTDQARVAGFLNRHGPGGLVVITMLGALFTGFGAPRQALAFVLGFAAGSLQGTLVSTLATALGASACFFTARWLLRAPLLQRFEPRMQRFDQLFREGTFLKVLMIRLLPVGSNLLTNLLAGCSGIRFLPFLLASVLGYLPQMMIFALAGAGLGQASTDQLLLSALLFVLASAIGAMLYHNRRNQSLANSVSDPS
ncbi:VTT domain-containing protein [Marinobacter daepoensis]|uniref:TVP38/TMEM64 family membrane protein n=1 Tax=Marinobacter daepoensis TaxID=262077 RepID=A0ABS3BBA1_9GAMM|nr:VTT domain-containing protein [Marinobacter daepoensis]MBN7768742.1 VTT domain-containing protein [Marinobacter daepoensis]MBY6032799.1 VTT domain-containing protein [Marinobacter daepoensis]MBY6079479.1 VTT domain-containing protein [Marinobacter daepoensis]